MIRLMHTEELNDSPRIYLHKVQLQKGTERHLKATPMQGTRIEFLANISTRCFLEGYPVSVERTPAYFSAIGHRLA